jgi:peptidoglycan pentaglycine glycine transferase (the first glycine)
MKIDFLDKNVSDWDQFVIENNGSFLQSFGWFKFENDLGREILKVRIKEKDKTIFQSLVIQKKIPFIKKLYSYIPYGPVFDRRLIPSKKREVMKLFLETVKEKTVFLRIEPYSETLWPEGFYYTKTVNRIQPQKTLTLNLKEPIEILLSNFQKNCRYNINLAERKGVKVIIKQDYSSEFYRLLKRVSNRNKFRIFKEEHYKEFFKLNDKNLKAKLFLGSYRKKVIAGYIVVFFNKTATCLHGSADLKYRKLKVANLLVWKRAEYAKNNGYDFLDLWGIDKNRWPGITNFKESFGGTAHKYPDSKDIVFNKPLYLGYNSLKKFL